MSEETHKIANAIKLVGETLLPGASLLVDGRVKEGALHTFAGVAARSLFGPVGWSLVAANSFARSVADKSLFDVAKDITCDVGNAFKRKPAAVNSASPEAASPAETDTAPSA